MPPTAEELSRALWQVGEMLGVLEKADSNDTRALLLGSLRGVMDDTQAVLHAAYGSDGHHLVKRTKLLIRAARGARKSAKAMRLW
jgi:hypothetical protein